MERNKIALDKYRIGEGARSEAAKLRLQERLGIEGLNVRRQQLGVQAGRDFARMASIMQDAREQAAKEVKEELASNPTVALTLKPGDREKLIEERANRIASKTLARSVSNLRVDED
jgi:sensor histidine kinase regulating citrate/malate metabolism